MKNEREVMSYLNDLRHLYAKYAHLPDTDFRKAELKGRINTLRWVLGRPSLDEGLEEEK